MVSQELLKQEVIQIQTIIENIFGDYGLEFVLADEKLKQKVGVIKHSALLNAFTLFYQTGENISGTFQSRLSLPVQTNAVKFILLRHVIENVKYPLLFLHECQRVLTSDGILLIVYFNKNHAHYQRFFRRIFDDSFATIVPNYVINSLKNLGFEIVLNRFLNNSGILQNRLFRLLNKHFSSLAPIGICLARKNTHGITPLKLNKKRLYTINPLAQPSTTNFVDNN